MKRTGVVVDGRRLWLRWLERELDRAGVVAVARSTSLGHASALVREHQPDLLVVGIDENVDETPHAAELRALRASAPALRVVIVSALRDQDAIDAAFRAGADAYCLRSGRSDDLLAAIRQAFSRSIYFPVSDRPAPERIARRRRPRRHDPHRLTKRELQILGLVADGHSNPEVARMLWLTEQTVKFHLRNVYRKLHVVNRIEASDWAHSHHVEADPVEPAPAGHTGAALLERAAPPVVAPLAPPPPVVSHRAHLRSIRRESACRGAHRRGL